jgi:hypothetical protein
MADSAFDSARAMVSRRMTWAWTWFWQNFHYHAIPLFSPTDAVVLQHPVSLIDCNRFTQVLEFTLLIEIFQSEPFFGSLRPKRP